MGGGALFEINLHPPEATVNWWKITKRTQASAPMTSNKSLNFLHFLMRLGTTTEVFKSTMHSSCLFNNVFPQKLMLPKICLKVFIEINRDLLKGTLTLGDTR